MLEIRSNTKVEMGSDRTFGVFLALVFAVLGMWPVFFGGHPNFWALGASSVVLVLAMVHAPSFHFLNVLWFKFGLVLHVIFTPVMMGVFFFLVVTPMGLLRRVVARDFFKLKFDPRSKSYWATPDTKSDEIRFRNLF